MKTWRHSCGAAPRELSSQTESQELIGELSQKLANHMSRVRELVEVPELTEGEVFQ